MLNLLGTSLIALPTDVAEMLNTQIGAKRSWNGQYTVDCSAVPSLPELTFYFDGKAYPLKGSDYILNVQGTCISSFTGLDINLPGGALWILGKTLTDCAKRTLIFFQVMSSLGATSLCTTWGAMPLGLPLLYEADVAS